MRPGLADDGGGVLGQERVHPADVVVVPVRPDDQRHPAPGEDGGDRGPVGRVVLAGSTTTASPDPGDDSTQVLVPSRVIGPALSSRTQVARSVTGPPVHTSGADTHRDLDLDGGVERQDRDPDGAARVLTGVAEDVPQQVRGAVDDPGWPVKEGALATKPTTLTTRSMASTPPATLAAAAMAFSAHVAASCWAVSASTSAPTLPVTASCPSTNGSCPDVRTRSPSRTAGT